MKKETPKETSDIKKRGKRNKKEEGDEETRYSQKRKVFKALRQREKEARLKSLY